MHGLLGNVFGLCGRRSGGVAASASSLLNTPSPATSQLSYVLSTFRFHNDVRPPAKSVAVHDLYSSSAAWQQLLHTSDISDRDKMMMLLYPLETYCVDLRGHNRSCALTVDPAAHYPQSCATDVSLFLRDVVAAPARLCGTGMGAMVSALTALRTPDMVSSLALFVADECQLVQCNMSAYSAIRDVLRAPLSSAQTLADVNAQLFQHVPDSTQRAVLLTSVASKAAVATTSEAKEGVEGKDRCTATTRENASEGRGWHFRYSEDVLQMNATFSLEECIERGCVSEACFDKPVRVYVTDASLGVEASMGSEARHEAKRRFCELFPRATFHALGEADRRVCMCASVIPETVISENTLNELAPFLAKGDDEIVQQALDVLKVHASA